MYGSVRGEVSTEYCGPPLEVHKHCVCNIPSLHQPSSCDDFKLMYLIKSALYVRFKTLIILLIQFNPIIKFTVRHCGQFYLKERERRTQYRIGKSYVRMPLKSIWEIKYPAQAIAG